MNRKQARAAAVKRGHKPGRFETRYFQVGIFAPKQPLYSVAWCKKCGGALFAGKDNSGVNPCVDHDCSGK